MTSLIITEKPSVASDLVKALGGNFTRRDGYYERDDLIVTGAVGHVVELSAGKDIEGQKWADVPLPLIPDFSLKPIEKSADVFKRIATLIKRDDVTRLINCCDAGREGELIFKLIVDATKTKKPCERMWPQSMTPESIIEAYNGRVDAAEKHGLAQAAISRAKADWLIGINATRACTIANLLGVGVFAPLGRVQTPTLALLVDRELAIRVFNKTTYYELAVDLHDQATPQTPFRAWLIDQEGGAQRFESEDAAKAIAQQIQTQENPTFNTTDEGKPVRKGAPLPFDLNSLQQYANEKFGYTAAHTLSIAQRLYEVKKVLTYPRTDSTHLPDDYPPTVIQVLGQLPECLPQGLRDLAQLALDENYITAEHKIFDSTKVSDHFAIIPTSNTLGAADLDAEESAIYLAVCQRLVAAFFPPAQFQETTRTACFEQWCFCTKGKVLVDPGWLAVYGQEGEQEDEGAGTALPALTNPLCPLSGFEAVKGSTKPPVRYTDATLLSAMKNSGRAVEDADYSEAMKDKGMGTSATRGAVIEELLKEESGYASRVKKYIVPTEKGMLTIVRLRGLGIDFLTKPELTGKWEYALKQIEEGTLQASEFMSGIEQLTSTIVDAFMSNAIPSEVESDILCRCKQSNLFEGSNKYRCPACELTVFKTMSSKAIVKGAVRDLMQTGKTKPMPNFISKKTGKPFIAALFINGENKVEMQFS